MSFHIITNDNTDSASTDYTYDDIILIKTSIDFYVAKHCNKFTANDFHKFKTLLHFTDGSLSADQADDLADLVIYAYHQYDTFIDFTNTIKNKLEDNGKPSLFETDPTITSISHFKKLITHMKAFSKELNIHESDLSEPKIIYTKLDHDIQLIKHDSVYKALDDIFKGIGVTPIGNVYVDNPYADLAMYTLYNNDLYENSSTVSDVFICKSIIRTVHDSLNRLNLPKVIVDDQLRRLSQLESVYHKGYNYVVCKFAQTDNDSDSDNDKMISVEPFSQADAIQFIKQMLVNYDNKPYQSHDKA